MELTAFAAECNACKVWGLIKWKAEVAIYFLFIVFGVFFSQMEKTIKYKFAGGECKDPSEDTVSWMAIRMASPTGNMETMRHGGWVRVERLSALSFLLLGCSLQKCSCLSLLPLPFSSQHILLPDCVTAT